jgi:hypothetical protein
VDVADRPKQEEVSITKLRRDGNGNWGHPVITTHRGTRLRQGYGGQATLA